MYLSCLCGKRKVQAHLQKDPFLMGRNTTSLYIHHKYPFSQLPHITQNNQIHRGIRGKVSISNEDF